MALEPITRQEQIIAGKDLEPITRMERFLKEYGGGAGGVVSDEQIKNAVENYLDENPIGVDLSVTGATVGQTVTISAVDENGVPTAWEAVNLPGGAEWEKIADVTLEEEVNRAVIFKGDVPYKHFSLVITSQPPTTNTDTEARSIHVYSTENMYHSSPFIKLGGARLSSGKRQSVVCSLSQGVRNTISATPVSDSGTFSHPAYGYSTRAQPVYGLQMSVDGSQYFGVGTNVKVWGVRA